VRGGDHTAGHARPAGLARVREAIGSWLEETSFRTALTASAAALLLIVAAVAAPAEPVPIVCPDDRSHDRHPERSAAQLGQEPVPCPGSTKRRWGQPRAGDGVAMRRWRRALCRVGLSVCR